MRRQSDTVCSVACLSGARMQRVEHDPTCLLPSTLQVDVRHLPPCSIRAPAQLRAEARLRGIAASLQGTHWLRASREEQEEAVRQLAKHSAAAATSMLVPQSSDGGIGVSAGTAHALLTALAIYHGMAQPSHIPVTAGAPPETEAWQAGIAALQAAVPPLVTLAHTHLCMEPRMGAFMPAPAMHALCEALWLGRHVLPAVIDPDAMKGLLAAATCWASAASGATSGVAEGAHIKQRAAAAEQLHQVRAMHRGRLYALTAHVALVETLEDRQQAAAAVVLEHLGTSAQVPSGPSWWGATAAAAGAIHDSDSSSGGSSSPAAAQADHLSCFKQALVTSISMAQELGGTSGSAAAACEQAVSNMRAAVREVIKSHGHSHPHTLSVMAMHAHALMLAAPLPAEDATQSVSALDAIASSSKTGIATPGAARQPPPPLPPQSDSIASVQQHHQQQVEESWRLQAESLALQVLEIVGMRGRCGLAHGVRSSGSHTITGSNGPDGDEGSETELALLLRAAADAHWVLAELAEGQGRWEVAARHYAAAADARSSAYVSCGSREGAESAQRAPGAALQVQSCGTGTPAHPYQQSHQHHPEVLVCLQRLGTCLANCPPGRHAASHLAVQRGLVGAMTSSMWGTHHPASIKVRDGMGQGREGHVGTLEQHSSCTW
jgi:hypothetical protein